MTLEEVREKVQHKITELEESIKFIDEDHPTPTVNGFMNEYLPRQLDFWKSILANLPA